MIENNFVDGIEFFLDAYMVQNKNTRVTLSKFRLIVRLLYFL